MNSSETKSKDVRSILVVDDHDLVRGFTRTALERVGYRVDMAANGQEALDKIRGGETYDLVITDINMSVMNGIDFLDQIQNEKGTVKVIYCATTAENEIQASIADRNLAGDVTAIIQKPCPLGTFLSTIESVLHPSVSAEGEGKDAP